MYVSQYRRLIAATNLMRREDGAKLEWGAQIRDSLNQQHDAAFCRRQCARQGLTAPIATAKDDGPSPEEVRLKTGAAGFGGWWRTAKDAADE